MRNGLLGWLRRDWTLRLAGLGIGIVLWAWVHSEQRIQITLSVPLELRNPPRAWRFVSAPPATVEVRLEADRAVFPTLKPQSIRAVADLAGVKARHVAIPLGPDAIVRPDGVTVMSVSPAQLVLDFAKRGD